VEKTEKFEDLAFAQVVKDWDLPVMVLDREMVFVYANEAYLKAVNATRDTLIGRHVFEAFPDTPERVEAVFEKFKACLGGERTQLDAQPFALKEKDGTVTEHFWQATQEPLRDAAGNVTHMIQYPEDVTARILLEQERALVAQEYNHRVKNVLGVVQAIARLTARGETSVKAFTDSFVSRIGSMGRVHGRLYNNDFAGASLYDILSDELDMMALRDRKNLTVSGPDMDLKADMAKNLSMVIHELATNAAKHGCFSKPDGHLSVTSSLKGDSLTVL